MSTSKKAKSKFVNFMKAHVVGPLTTSVGAVVAAVAASGKDADPKEVALVFVGAILGTLFHKEVIVRFGGEADTEEA